MSSTTFDYNPKNTKHINVLPFSLWEQ